MKTLADLTQELEVRETQGDLGVRITGLTYDSRRVEPGFLFVCVEGYKTDGHQFISAALSNGAAAVVVQKPVEVPEGFPLVRVADTRRALALLGAAWAGHPSRRLVMVGVTGTNGKTTTTFLLERIFQEQGYHTGLIGTVMNKIGDRVLPVTNTTPESLDLHLLLREMADSGVTHVVMEVSSHALELGRTEGVEYDTAVFTNLTQDHLDFHGTMENYLAAKKALFSELGRQARKTGPKFAVINRDDPSAASITAAAAGPVMTYGINGQADIQARNVKLGADRVSFEVLSARGDWDLELHLPGLFNVYNALAAAGAALANGVEPEVIRRALESVKGVPGRMEKVEEGQDFLVLVDYAHTPDGLENIIKAARAFTRGRVITVFGCGGDRDRTKRPIMGEISGRLSDYSVITSDNPRTEDPLMIIARIEEGIRRAVDRTAYSIIPDRRDAINFAIGMARTGDVILIAGKGHETYQMVRDQVLHFDDREVAGEALRKKLGTPVR